MTELIFRDFETAFGVCIQEIHPVSGGYLNRKWRVRTDAGDVLLKQYSHERFNRKKLNEIEQALARQMILYDQGIPCPRVWKAGETIIRRPSEEIDYMVMEFLPGESAGPDAVNLLQMESLGEVCARMHEAFRRLPCEGVKGYPMNRNQLLAALKEAVRPGAEEEENAPEAYREAVKRARRWAEKADFSFLSRIEASIAHEDFTPDNMLFSGTGLSAVLDFDRNQFSFPLHDIGRVLMSLACHDGKMIGERVSAFRSGYARCARLTDSDISDALKLTALIEIPWWIRPGCFAGSSPKVRRFAEEMLFLIRNISEFDG